MPFDRLEEWSTGAADGLVVNSHFTRRVFSGAFLGLNERRVGVVYPCVDTRSNNGDEDVAQLWAGKKVVLSINRFERKKGVELALKAFAELDDKERSVTRLVIAGKTV